jgi:septal ring factor EnvC (AmiA/AmiB activator)
MNRTPSQRIGFALVALSLVLCFPVYAQQNNNSSVLPMNNNAMEPNQSEWNSENFNRQSFREEMEQIRREHEELEEATDQLMEKCMNANGPQMADCQQERQALHERREKLHERMHALHEKMEAARSERQQEHLGNTGGPRPNNFSNSGSPGGNGQGFNGPNNNRPGSNGPGGDMPPGPPPSTNNAPPTSLPPAQ